MQEKEIEKGRQMARKRKIAQFVSNKVVLTSDALYAMAREDDYDAAMACIDFARQNAMETEGAGPDDIERLTMDSICCTAPFNEKKEIRDWFESKGYFW